MSNYIIEFNKDSRKLNISHENELDDKNFSIHEDKNYILIIDGYFLNMDEVEKSYLNKKSSKFQEILIASLLKKSEIIKMLDGSFNIYFFNKKDCELKIIRDYWGSRPSYFHKKSSGFIFSNDLKVLKNNLPMELTANMKKIKEFLSWQFFNDESTYYNEIKKPLPGHIYKINSTNITKNKFSIFVLEKSANEKFTKERFSNLLENAVSKRAKRFKRIGLMLSGGLDSSSIAIALKNTSKKEVKTISANFSHLDKNTKTDETKYQKNVSSFTNYMHKNVELRNVSVMEAIKNYMNIFNEPMLIPNLYFFESICKNLKHESLDAIFDGNDGDNVVSHGYETIYSHFKRFDVFNFYASINSYSEVHNKNKKKMFIFFFKSCLKKLINYKPKDVNTSLLLDSHYIAVRKTSIKNILDSHKSKLLNDLHYIAFENRFKIFKEIGIEPVSPFYDRNLINFCLNMPNKFKLRFGFTRYILRQYLSDFLPKKHSFRPHKSNLAKGLEANFSEKDMKLLEHELENINPKLLNILDIEKLNEILLSWKIKNQLSEREIINLQIFLNLNIFLNSQFHQN